MSAVGGGGEAGAPPPSSPPSSPPGPSSSPSLAPVYARAVLSARRKGAALRSLVASGRALELPGTAVVVPGQAVTPERALALARATAGPARPVLPAVGPHLLAFAAQLQLLSAEEVPLPLPGLVHVEQRLRQHRPLGVGEPAEVRVAARGPLPHPKGVVVELDAQVRVGDELVWEGTSAYLARGVHPHGLAAARDRGGPALPEPPSRTAARWRVPLRAGRAYAAVSGDVNPIHLSSLAARGLGFPGAIAHGMWTLARAVGQVEPRLGPAVQVRARFGSPVLLGARAVLCAAPARSGGWALAVRSGPPVPGAAGAPGERLHLTALAAPLAP